MLVIIAPDSFKGTATAAEAAAALSAGVRSQLPDATVVTVPMADGGEGTARALADAASSSAASGPGAGRVEVVTLPVTDAVGRLTEASYFLDRATDTAFIDVAAASGLPAVADALDPLHADTYGTGVLIADAESRGATHIVLGLGGSATIDGGSGILAALGAACHDARGYALPKGGAPLVQLDSIDTAQLNMKAAMLDYTLLADTRVSPLHAPAVFGPQKGATPEQAALLTGALMKLCEVTGIDAKTESFGAAGAVPVSLTWVSSLLWGDDSHVRVVPGAHYVAQAAGLADKLAKADLVITGEGSFDPQSLTGKVVGEVAAMAAAAGVPVGIAAGRVDDEAVDQLRAGLPANADSGFDVQAVQLAEAVNPADNVTERLRAAGAELAQLIPS